MLHLERLTSTAHPEYRKAMDLYQESFPLHEQRRAPSQERILADGDYCFGLVRDSARLVGLALFWENGRFVYIEHLCVFPDMRNQQYGQKILSLLKEKGKVIILEIDPPLDDISERRKGFYERCGFVENPYRHIHPPYHPAHRGHELVVMTYPGSISPESYQDFRVYLENRIMKDALT